MYNFYKITFFILIFLINAVIPLSAASSDLPDNTDAKQESADSNSGQLKLVLPGIGFAGGISAGYFFASNPGIDTSDDEFLLSNLLIEISSSDDNIPIGFVAAFGQTSTPSLLGTPENNTDYKIEYASLTVKPVSSMSLELGLLLPNAGYENSYTLLFA